MHQALKITGQDSYSFLQAQATNDLSNLKNQDGIYTAFLTPQARIRSLTYLYKDGDHFYLVDRDDRITNTKKDLERFIITEDVSIELETRLPKEFELVLEDFNQDDTLIKINLVNKYVSFNKGCFPGQEVLAKFKNIGQKKRQEKAQSYVDEALDIFARAQGSEENLEYQKVIELLKQALREDPRHEDAYETLGVILARLGRYQEAIMVMHQLEMINPQNPMAQTNLSIFYMKIGDKERAEEHKAKGTILAFTPEL